MIVYDYTVSERYAQALFNVTSREGNQGDVKQEAEELLKLFEPNSKIRVFLEGPQIPTEDKERLLNQVFQGKINPYIFQLMRLLLAKGRIDYVRPILDRYRVLVERAQGIFEADVATAKPLQESEKGKLQSALEAFTKAQLKIRYLVDPGLIGGVRFSYGDVLVDDTVKGKLDKLRQQLEAAAAGRV